MSVKMIQDRLDGYGCRSRLEEDQALRQITQEIVLAALGRTDFFHKAGLQGGTCLRVFHGLNRFSEDLDFALHAPDASFAAFVVFVASSPAVDSSPPETVASDTPPDRLAHFTAGCRCTGISGTSAENTAPAPNPLLAGVASIGGSVPSYTEVIGLLTRLPLHVMYTSTPTPSAPATPLSGGPVETDAAALDAEPAVSFVPTEATGSAPVISLAEVSPSPVSPSAGSLLADPDDHRILKMDISSAPSIMISSPYSITTSRLNVHS